MLTCHRPTLSLAVFAVGSIEYSLWTFGQLSYLRLVIHKYAHLLAPDTVSERVCRWLDGVLYQQLLTARVLPFNNPHIYSIAIVRQCFTGYAVGLIVYSLWNFEQLAYF